MDGNNHVSEVQRSEHEHRAVCALTRIEPLRWSAERLQWIWKCLLTQDYAFDDLALKLGAEAFIAQVFNPDNEWWEVGNVGIASVTGIVPLCNATVHFAIWGEAETREVFQAQRELFTDLFERYKLNRITAYIPAFNKQAIRLATIAGFKFEGEMRKCFLKNGTYHNLHVYGILRDEFNRREVRN